MADLPAKLGVPITQLGDSVNELGAKVQAGGTRILLPAQLKGEYAYSFKLSGYAR
jgi:hypothetical protein